ncbi:cyanobacterial phytochrome A [Geobacter sp. OR-1]|uniref:sensor histidine kinase n=1 Tax=Geobacter sp. OR-1 TaxID=1266765 RepID=UPI000542FF07|nr:ATP-binding protein [Geobacter sp. OR-1]GAM11437.1 cyanobacterial phytochrome A [Geobacter sp. OR-1]
MKQSASQINNYFKQMDGCIRICRVPGIILAVAVSIHYLSVGRTFGANSSPGGIAGSDPELCYLNHTAMIWGAVIVLGLLAAIIGLLLKISTERKQAAKILEEKTQELEQRVQERTLQLSESNRLLREEVAQRSKAQEEIGWLNDDLERRAHALENANNELEAFSYSVSHDLRAPLRHIEGFSRLLLEECEAALDVNGREYLDRVCKATRRMALLIDDLLKLSRVTSGSLNCQYFDMTRIATEVVAELRELHPERRISCTIAEGMEAWGDPHLLRIVLANYLGNAWKYTSKKDEATVEFGCHDLDGEHIFYVKDNGVGFDMTYSDRLFGTFQRLHHANEFEGTGIGLATVRRIVNRHEGRTWGVGEPGVGSTFYFALPITPPTELPRDAKPHLS